MLQTALKPSIMFTGGNNLIIKTMKNSMTKLKYLAIAISIAMFSCTDEEDLLVYVSLENISMELENQIDSFESRIPTSIRWDKNIDSIFANSLPDVYVGVENEEGNLIGYQGYVDLGLTTYWAVGNLGSPLLELPNNKNWWKKFSDFCNHKDFKSKMEQRFNPLTNIPQEFFDKYELPGYISYDDYITYVEPYKKSVRDMTDAIQQYVEDAYEAYTSYMLEHKYSYISNIGGYVMWGNPELMSKDNGINFNQNWESFPMRLETATHDAAMNLWGKQWSTPTKEQMDELVNKCKVTPYSISGIYGIRIIGPSKKEIYLPAGNYQQSSYIRDYRGSQKGYYLTADRVMNVSISDKGCKHYGLEFGLNYNSVNNSFSSAYGYSLRPVYRKN